MPIESYLLLQSHDKIDQRDVNITSIIVALVGTLPFSLKVYSNYLFHPGITNYPIGVGINANGEVTIADNHNNFNLTVFSQDGQVLNWFFFYVNIA